MYLFTLRKQFVLFKEFTYETAASNSKRNEVNMHWKKWLIEFTQFF